MKKIAQGLIALLAALSLVFGVGLTASASQEAAPAAVTIGAAAGASVGAEVGTTATAGEQPVTAGKLGASVGSALGKIAPARTCTWTYGPYVPWYGVNIFGGSNMYVTGWHSHCWG